MNTTIIKELNIRLAEGEESRVYVLANTGDPEWAKDKDLTTVEKFVAYEYPLRRRMWKWARTSIC